MTFQAEDVEPYILAVVIKNGFSNRLPRTYVRRDTFLTAFQSIVESDLAEYGHTLRSDQMYIALSLFEKLLSDNVIVEENDKLAGSYYAFSMDRAKVWRDSWLNHSEIYLREQKIGSDFIASALHNFYEIDDIDTVIEAPASDRIVALDHNSVGLVEIQDAVIDLEDRIRSSNDLGFLSVDEKDVAASEVARLRDDLAGMSVRLSYLKDRASKTLTWIGTQAAGSLVGTAAVALLGLIAAYFGFNI